ncbi:hypothetical protein ACFLWS_03165 [Chloroflexota bacterium]
MRIAFKYCGSCNPEVDLAQIGHSLAAQVQQRGWQLITLGVGTEADVLVLLCGCPRTCIDKEDLYRQAKQVVLVAGKRLGWLPLKEAALPQAVIEAINGYNKSRIW